MFPRCINGLIARIVFGRKRDQSKAPPALAYHRAADLVPYTKNARTHSEAQVDALIASIEAFGMVGAIVTRGGMIAKGHGTLLAVLKLYEAGSSVYPPPGRAGGAEPFPAGMVPVIDASGWTVPQFRAFVIADNQLALRAGWDLDLLGAELRDLKMDAFDLAPLGFELPDLEKLLAGPTPPADLNEIPPVRAAVVSRPGDIWILGAHRVMCGDTTDPAAVAQLLAGARPVLIHADPPYGMGKEAAGIINDNLYEAKLDAFQMQWWHAWADQVTENASAYIWGQAPDLWRLWWVGGLGKEPAVMQRNEIVWDKGSGFGITGEGAHSYVVSTERCLFVMLGQQFLGNQNIADYWEGYEPLRAWLEAQRNQAGWSNGDVNKLTKTQMAGHWFSKSQFIPISAAHYALLARAAEGKAFAESYDDLFGRLFPGAKAGGNARRRELAAELRERRSYFDNTHAAMTEVWQFPRVTGEERHGHATPKPVAMVERAVKTSSQEGDCFAAPFGGTGPELIAAERLGRSCVAMEIEPAYVDVMVRRWEAFTGKKATLEQSEEGITTEGPATLAEVMRVRGIAIEEPAAA